MSDAFLGQVMLTAFGFAPKYWAQCNGQLLPVAQNSALFALLGTKFGGDGKTNFALPDLRSRTPVGGFPPISGPQSYSMGQAAGAETVTLLPNQMPMHTHMAEATTAPGSTQQPAGNLLAGNTSPAYASQGPLIPLGGSPLSPAGGGQPHSNMQPFQTVNMNICLYGTFPPRN